MHTLLSRSVPQDVDHDFPLTSVVSMLPDKHPLPGAQHQSALS